ncbi:MAG: HAD-IIA family hydrolase [Armatimonadetes bacterium]|nr:HAD-IIA family hydrolase [Armatimonadota bacterium]
MSRALYIFDLDGVIYRGDTPQPHAADCIRRLTAAGHAIYYLTNNASRTRESFAQKLSAMDIPTEPRQVMNSSYGTVLWLREFGQVASTVMVVGEQGCFDELNAGGMRTVTPGDGHQPDYVVVGIDRSFTYQKLWQAQTAILNGAVFIATNRDSTFPYESGIAPGAGSIVAAVAEAVGRQPFTIGKPETFLLDQVIKDSGIARERAIMVGDRLDTDIAAGNRAGVKTVLALGGVASREDAAIAEEEMRPQVIIDNLSELE